MKKISGIYKITNAITNDFYIGSSKDVKRRWRAHKWPSTWNNNPNNPMYQDMKNYGVENFVFEILEVVEPEELKETEQKFIELLKPAYNDRNANGWDVERKKEYDKEYHKTDKYKEYEKSDKRKKYKKEYNKSDKRKKYNKEYHKEYNNQLCFYNGETLTLNALSKRFWRQGIPHPQIEAKKYLLNK